MTSEAQYRIDYLNTGPWIEKGQLAWERIGRPPRPGTERQADSKTQRDLKKLLRPHWESDISDEEGVIRDAFDEALSVYKLYELAIENQYLSVGDIVERVRRELTDLFWSDGARAYLKNYNYVAIVCLAQRVGVDLGFERVALPSMRKGAEGRFASFLSQYTLWYSDPVLDDWLGFLDDYQQYGDKEKLDKEVFWRFLDTKQHKFDNEIFLWGLVAGADRFVTSLAELAASLTREERPSYGLFYSYWLSKFYGYGLTGNGYIRDSSQEDWSEVLLGSERLAFLNGAVSAQTDVLAAFRSREAFVRELWKDTVDYLKNNPIVGAK